MEEQLVDAAMQISEQRKRIQALEEETQLQRAAMEHLRGRKRQKTEEEVGRWNEAEQKIERLDGK